MSCRKHSPGNPCCEECCATLTNPTDWTMRNDCCAQCSIDLTASWSFECSAAIRTDVRSASVDFQYYLRDLGVYSEPFLELCIEDPPGVYTCPDGITLCTEAAGIWSCTGGGVIPECDTTPELCGTISISRSEDYTLKLVARWMPISRTTTLSRVLTTCDAEETPTCKWLMISRTCVRIEWGVYWFTASTDYVHSNSVCCTVTEINTTSSAATCEYASGYMYQQNVTHVCLTRMKYFTSLPSGIVTLNPGDTVDCDFDINHVCAPPLGQYAISEGDEIEIIGPTGSSEQPWTAPSCTTSSSTVDCPFAQWNSGICSGYFYDEDQPLTYAFAGVTGSLLSWNHANTTIEASCNGADFCHDWKEHIQTTCGNLVSSRTASGHTNRSILITLPAWTVDLGGCE